APPASVSLLSPSVPKDLETICMKCLEKSPVRRYPSARALADDLGRFLKGEPIEARPITRLQRLGRWCVRRPLVAGLTGSLIAVFGLGLLGVLAELGRAERAERRSRERLLDAYLAQAKAARQTLQAGRRSEILEAIRGAARIRPTGELRN